MRSEISCQSAGFHDQIVYNYVLQNNYIFLQQKKMQNPLIKPIWTKLICSGNLKKLQRMNFTHSLTLTLKRVGVLIYKE